MVVNLSRRFKRAYKKFPAHIKNDFDKRITLFMQDTSHPSLKAHRLRGRYQECLAFRLRDGYRVLFEFSARDTIDLLDAGPHDIYRKR